MSSTSHSEHPTSCFYTRSYTEYPPSEQDSCLYKLYTPTGTGFGSQLNIQQLLNENHIDHQKQNPQSPETNLLWLWVEVGDHKQSDYKSKKAVFFKCFLLHRRTNAGCDVCLVLLIYFCRNLQLGVCTFWRYHACIASERFYTISSLSNKFIHSIHKSRM